MKIKNNKFFLQCFCFGCEFQFGPHRYEGKHLPGYDIDVCNNCYEANWDGWNSLVGDALIKHMEEKGIKVPKKNRNGFLPRDYPQELLNEQTTSKVTE